MKIENIVFVFEKDNTTVVLDYYECAIIESELLNTGWKHVETIDTVQFVKNYYKKNAKLEATKNNNNNP